MGNEAEAIGEMQMAEIPPHPVPLVNFNAIPEELKSLQQWVLWKTEERDGKSTKVPHTPWGLKADSTDARTWSAFSIVVEAYKKGGYDGIGFVLRPPYVGLDLDKCILEDGSIEPQAEEIIKRLDSYSEKSPSGKGVHVIAKGHIPRGRKKGAFEMYQSGRYFTITGDHLQGTPATIEEQAAEVTAIYDELFGDSPSVEILERFEAVSASISLSDDQIITIAEQAKNGPKFKRLMAGNISGYPSESEADGALVALLAFYTKDRDQICRIIKQSKLWDEKWEREDYQERTICGALELVTESYSGNGEKTGRKEGSPSLDDLTKWTGKPVPVINEDTGLVELDESGQPITRPGRALSPSKAAEALRQGLPLAVAKASLKSKELPIWIYNAGIWHDQGEREIVNLVDSAIGDLSYDRGLRETLRRIKGELARVPVVFDADPFLMPLQDGVVDLRTGEFREAKPADYLTFRYNAAWQGLADYKPFLWHLCSSLPDPRDVLTAIDMIVAAAIRIAFEIYNLLFGPGGNGKGVFEDIIIAFFGLERASTMRLSELKNSRFGEGALLDKDLWIVSEVEGVKDVHSLIKKISSGEPIDADVKWGGRRQGRPHVLPIFDANTAFDFGDESRGQKRRFRKLDFPFTFGDRPEDRPKDPLLKEKLTRPEVLNGLARIIAARATVLIESRDVYHRKSSAEIQEEYKRQRFSLNYFCSDCLSTTWPEKQAEEVSSKLTTERAYSEYLEYCRLFNVTPAERSPFGKYIFERFGIQSVNTRENNNQIRYYPGLFLAKTAACAHKEICGYSSYSLATAKLQEEYSHINISSWLTTGATGELGPKLLRDVLKEVKNMFDFIKSCKSLQEISYREYLKNAVAPVAAVAGSHLIAEISATAEKNPVAELNPPVAEERISPSTGGQEEKTGLGPHPRRNEPIHSLESRSRSAGLLRYADRDKYCLKCGDYYPNGLGIHYKKGYICWDCDKGLTPVPEKPDPQQTLVEEPEPANGCKTDQGLTTGCILAAEDQSIAGEVTP